MQDCEKELLSVRNGRDASFLDVCSIDDLSDEDLPLIFELAREFRKHKTAKTTLCKGRSQINAFFEASTRTMSSFDLSGKHLGMDTNNVGTGASTKKGESYIDTAETLDAYNAAVIIVRSAEAGVSEQIRKIVKASIINAGDGWHEHPTQALLDALTMLDYFGTDSLEGKIVTVIGDIMHSRVFGSLVRILNRFKATIRVAAPETFFPEGVENWGVQKFYDVEEALVGSDIVYTLRVQEERGAKGFIPTIREYSKTFGINEKRLALAKKDAIIMHPGPVIRDVDVHSALVARHDQSAILTQVENGMAIRKSLLWLLAKRFDGKEKSFRRI
jgi:aspartate carbamoyltransferase catalytic subunit